MADQRAGGRRDLVLRAGDLDPTRLAAPAGVDLRLDAQALPPRDRAASTASAAV
jgi:hypothetical protein